MKKVLLYSGGMDSWLIDKLWKPDVKVYVKLGTKNSDEEIKRLPKDIIVADFSELHKHEEPNNNFILPLRNLFLVELASYYGDEICLGSTADDIHLDNCPEFISHAEDVLNYLWKETGRHCKIVMPFAHLTKAELLREYIKQGGDVECAYKSTFSCYTPIDGKECGACSSCSQKRKAFELNGYTNF